MHDVNSVPRANTADAAAGAGVSAHALREAWSRAVSFGDFVAGVQQYPELWRAMASRARVPDDLVPRALALPARWRLLVLLEDWCGDAVNTIPVLAALADTAPNLELRVLPRDENPALMDAHLSPTGARAIPVVMVLDEQFVERGWWGSRPAELQRWVTSPAARELDPADRYREVRRWYAQDRGRSTLLQVLRLLEEATDATPRAA